MYSSVTHSSLNHIASGLVFILAVGIIIIIIIAFIIIVICRIISETFKERPAPRKPDYLRESFDLTQITMETNLPPSVQSTHVHVTARDDDETKPRPSLPVPYLQMRSNIHPHQRNPREESIVFPSSSCDETSSLLTEGPEESRMDAYGKILYLLAVVFTSPCQ